MNIKINVLRIAFLLVSVNKIFAGNCCSGQSSVPIRDVHYGAEASIMNDSAIGQQAEQDTTNASTIGITEQGQENPVMGIVVQSVSSAIAASDAQDVGVGTLILASQMLSGIEHRIVQIQERRDEEEEAERFRGLSPERVDAIRRAQQSILEQLRDQN